MDCADIVIGAAIGRLSRVKDYYTADRSTPKEDQFYGGTQSLTAAIASQSDTGVTTVIFRRPLIGQFQSRLSSFCLYIYRLSACYYVLSSTCITPVAAHSVYKALKKLSINKIEKHVRQPTRRS